MQQFDGTTIVSVRRGNQVALGGDGQVTLGNIVIKASARKVRTLYHDKILAGFAGSVADAFTLFEKFEGKLEAYNGNLQRAAVELAKEWRTDRVLRKLEALLLGHPKVMDAAVIGVLDDEREEIPKAFIVAAPDSGLTEDEVKAYVAEHVAPYKKVRRVEFIDAVTYEILFFADSTHGVINCRDQQHLRVFSANLIQFFYHFGAQFRRLLNF